MPTNPYIPSDLDFSQCIQGAYDEGKGRIRVEGEATIVNGALEVLISSTTDNIAIRNTNNNNELLINADGSINVNSTFSGTITVGQPDKSAFTYGTSTELAIGGVYQDASPTLAAGTTGAVRLTQYRAFHVNLRDSLGNEITSSGGALNVNSVVTGSVIAHEAGLDNFQTSQYTVGLSVVQITPTPLVGRSSITIRMDKNNLGAIYIGNSAGVTTSTGYPLFAGDTLGMDLTDLKTIYAIADTASQKLAVLEMA